MHLIIYFSGTDIVADEDNGGMKRFNEVPNVSTISVRGCAHEEVCGNGVFPNLEEFAHRFVDSVFISDEGGLRLTETDLSALKVGIRKDGTNVREKELLSEEPLNVTSITLCGSSRGAVTCFNVARELQRRAPDVEIDIVANQPVPGNIYPAPGTIASSVKDCTDLKNVKNAAVILGTYTDDSYRKEDVQTGIVRKNITDTFNLIHEIENKKLENELAKGPKKRIEVAQASIATVSEARKISDDALAELQENGVTELVKEKMKGLGDIGEKIGVKQNSLESTASVMDSLTAGVKNLGQKIFFSQIVPELPKDVNQKIVVIPEVSHIGGSNHMQLEVAESLHRRHLVDKNFVDSKKTAVKNAYASSGKLFPLSNAVQEVFGISPERMYQHLDELHPQPNLRRGYEFKENQSLIDWWNIQDKNASSFSSGLTNALVNIVKITDSDDKTSLLNLYKACETWLVKKSEGISSRYGQVTALRNEIYDRLINQHHVPKKDLIEIKEKIHHDHKFLQKEWRNKSSYASFFKTTATSELDKAFEEHGKFSQSEKNDRKLLKAMDKWLDEKDRSVSKRYDLVLEMRNRLEESINIRYPDATADEPSGRPSISNSK